MNRDTWERQFKQKLQQQLGITPEQVRFHWRAYYNQRFTPEQAIAHLKQTHELYPELGLLNQTLNSGENTIMLKA